MDVGKPTHGLYHYNIKLDAHEYAELLQIVVGVEYNTSLALRRALATAQKDTGKYHGGKPYFMPLDN